MRYLVILAMAVLLSGCETLSLAALGIGGSAAVGLGVEARLPTGDEANLLGTGGVQTKIFGIASMNHGRFAPHVTASAAASPANRVRAATSQKIVAGTHCVARPRPTPTTGLFSPPAATSPTR